MQSTFETRSHAQDVLDYIEANPDEHDQSQWINDTANNACGTTMCVAGTSIMLTHGKRYLLDMDGNYDILAAKSLGLSDMEAGRLFLATIRKDNPEATALEMLRAVANGDEDKFFCVFDNANWRE